MANAKGASRVIGRNGENMWVEDDELCFKTGGSVERMATDVLANMEILNVEEAREAVNTAEKVPHGAWVKNMTSSGGKTMYLVATGRANLWVMEINKSQVPNASAFVSRLVPEDEDKNSLRIPNRVINTPLGGLFTVGSIVCLILAVFAVYNFQQPLIGLALAGASIAMYNNVR